MTPRSVIAALQRSAHLVISTISSLLDRLLDLLRLFLVLQSGFNSSSNELQVPQPLEDRISRREEVAGLVVGLGSFYLVEGVIKVENSEDQSQAEDRGKENLEAQPLVDLPSRKPRALRPTDQARQERWLVRGTRSRRGSRRRSSMRRKERGKEEVGVGAEKVELTFPFSLLGFDDKVVTEIFPSAEDLVVVWRF